ncbi:MAG: hypothetical protein JST12_03980 [Armatimonadetes bacterium]|nr:hypothetical protein [Armatimonadota bacterium]MBS1700796.1 hypothetical protein [Armatimonadota bacterium]MBS1728714.1 hypothetical protein [Armatimonadota bacterium]
MKLVHPLFLAVFATALVGFQAEDTYTLRQKPVKDTVEIYQTTIHASTEEGDFIYDVKDKTKVTKVEDDGAYEAETTVLGGKITIGGEEHVIDPDDAPKTEKYDKDGNKIKDAGDDDEDEDDPVSQVFQQYFDFRPDKAVKVGDTWTHESDFGTLKLKLEGKEKVGDVECLKVTATGTLSKKDATGDATGTFYLRVADFSPEKVEATIDNPSFGEGQSMKKIEIKLVRVAE